MEHPLTPDEIEEIKEHNHIADRNHDEAMARNRRREKEGRAIDEKLAELRRQTSELEAIRRETRTDAWEAKCEAIEATKGRLFLPYDSEPEEVADVGEWTRQLRRRAWATAFSDNPVSRLFAGPTGTRDLMLFLSLCTLAERQMAQVVDADVPTMVRLAAMDNKTVASGLKSLRDTNLLKRVGTARHSPVGNPLLPISNAPELPQTGIGARFCNGDREHDAFGGRFGIKPIWIRTWVWLYQNPGAICADIAKRAGPKGQTAYRVIGDMTEKAHLVRMDNDGKCSVIEPHTTSKRWLDEYAHKYGLLGAVDKRVERAICPVEVQIKRTRVRSRRSQTIPEPQTRFISAERKAEIAAKVGFGI